VDELADGRIYSAPQALKSGLIDRVGGIEEAVSRLESRVGTDRSFVVSYHRPTEWRNNLYTRAPLPRPRTASATDPGSWMQWLRPGFHYLWWPGAAPY
jgi:ClpP class serine protease